MSIGCGGSRESMRTKTHRRFRRPERKPATASLNSRRRCLPTAAYPYPGRSTRHQLPLTTIGKIHKPTLRLRELERVTRDVLGRADIAFDDVQAVADERRGNLVRIRAHPDKAESIPETLRSFAFAHEVVTPLDSG